MQRMLHMGYQTVATERWKYIHYTQLRGMDGLYHLQSGPYELHNLIKEASARATLDSSQR